MLVQQLF